MSTSYAVEFKWHHDFFLQQDDFEGSYHHWYSLKLESHCDIMKGVLFDWMVYTLHVEVLVHARDLINQTSKHSSDFDMRLGKGPQFSFSVDVSSTQAPFHVTTSVCILCGKEHCYRDHPSLSSSFDNGKPLFCHLTDGSLYTVKPFKGPSSKHICTVWNISKPCNGQHGADCVHCCSLCSGDHPALECNNQCSHVAEGCS